MAKFDTHKAGHVVHKYFPHVEHFAAVSYASCEVFALHHVIIVFSGVLMAVGLVTFLMELREG